MVENGFHSALQISPATACGAWKTFLRRTFLSLANGHGDQRAELQKVGGGNASGEGVEPLPVPEDEPVEDPPADDGDDTGEPAAAPKPVVVVHPLEAFPLQDGCLLDLSAVPQVNQLLPLRKIN